MPMQANTVPFTAHMMPSANNTDAAVSGFTSAFREANNARMKPAP
jgi:hypothetical protein